MFCKVGGGGGGQRSEGALPAFSPTRGESRKEGQMHVKCASRGVWGHAHGHFSDFLQAN